MNENTWMPMDVDGHGKEDGAYKGLDPDLNDEYVTTQFYAGMEKIESYLGKQAAFLSYMEAEGR